MARWQMRTTSTQAIMAATREEESWLIGIAGTVGANCPRTTASVQTVELLSTKQRTSLHRRRMSRFHLYLNKPGKPPWLEDE
jgi:hypothetical protein